MGASGAGKTTALDVLAQRKNIGVITGDMLVDGRPLDVSFVRNTAYGVYVFVVIPARG
jgi:ATP-binding cassette, subfamily G (WHITE), member 2, SNQ2